MIINGKQIAEEVVAALARERAALPERLVLGVILGEGDAATESFVRIKERLAGRLNVVLEREVLAPSATTEEAIAALARLAPRTQGIIVQLPLPAGTDTEAVLAAVPLSHDVDAINPAQRLVRAPVAEAIVEIFARANVTARGARAVVVGAGRLVGAPAAALLQELGAEVTVVTATEGSLESVREADIVVLGAGTPGLVTPSMLTQGVVLIDAGTSEQGGRVAGDADPACAQVASVFTPVPGGVGPIAVAMIFKNLFILVHKRKAA